MTKLHLKWDVRAFQYFAVMGAHGDPKMMLAARADHIYE